MTDASSASEERRQVKKKDLAREDAMGEGTDSRTAMDKRADSDKHQRRFTVLLSEHEIELICEGLTQREMWGSGDRLCERLEYLVAARAALSPSAREATEDASVSLPPDGEIKE